MTERKESLVSKITLKSIGVQPKPQTIKENDAEKPLCVIYGRVQKYDIATSNFGESGRFHGAFEAVNAATGELFKSGKAFLPGVVESLMMDAVNAADGGSVDFALEIGVKPANSATGYEYTVRPLQKLAVSDELQALRDIAGGASFLALSQDKGNADKEPEKAPKAAAKK